MSDTILRQCVTAICDATDDLEIEAKQASTVDRALRLHDRIRFLIERLSGVEELALQRADALCDRSAVRS